MTRVQIPGSLEEYLNDAPPLDPKNPPAISPTNNQCPEVPNDPPISRPNPVKPPEIPTEPPTASTNWGIFVLACLIFAGVLILLFTTCTKNPGSQPVSIDFKPVLTAINGISQDIRALANKIPATPTRPPRRPRPYDSDKLAERQRTINWLYKVNSDQATTIKKLQAQLKTANKSGIDIEKYRIDQAYQARKEYLRIFLSTPFKPGDGERVLCFSDGEPCYVRDSRGTKKTILPFN